MPFYVLALNLTVNTPFLFNLFALKIRRGSPIVQADEYRRGIAVARPGG
jgi:hypothetical protein